MNRQRSAQDFVDAEWLFAIGKGSDFPDVDGLISVKNYDREGRPVEEVALVEKAASYGARAVFFEIGQHGWAAVAQALIFDIENHRDDKKFAALHKRLWSWGGVPIVYRAGLGQIQLFRCAHKPDFASPDGTPICKPVKTLSIGADIAEVWWDAVRIRNGDIWDDSEARRLMLSANDAAHRALVKSVRKLLEQMSEQKLLGAGLQRRLLIFTLLIAYLEERSVLRPADFDRALPGSTKFLQVLGDGPALISLMETLEKRFNGHIFKLKDGEKDALANNDALTSYARLVEGFEESSGQRNFWKLYSFRDLPVEILSNIYQMFVKNERTAVYTPPALVRLILVLNFAITAKYPLAIASV